VIMTAAKAAPPDPAGGFFFGLPARTIELITNTINRLPLEPFGYEFKAIFQQLRLVSTVTVRVARQARFARRLAVANAEHRLIPQMGLPHGES
jgi:hypothetical protein